MNVRLKSELSKLTREIMPVMIGVLMALFVNNWHEDYQNKTFYAKLLATIDEENKENLTKINDALSRQRALRDTMILYLNDTSVTIFQIVRKVDGLSIPDIVFVGTDHILNSGHILFEVEDLLRISSKKLEIENFQYSQKKLTDYFYMNTDKRDITSKQKFLLILYDMMYYEERIERLSE